MDASAYRQLLLNLLPPGQAWTRVAGSQMDKLMLACAQEWARFDLRATKWLSEVVLFSASETLRQREAEAGIPQACETLGATVQARRDRLVSQWRATGGASIQYFLDLGASLGHPEIVIEEVSADEFRVEISTVETPLYTGEWNYVWRVYVDDIGNIYFRSDESMVGDRLVEQETSSLECIFERLKPAHTYIEWLPLP